MHSVLPAATEDTSEVICIIVNDASCCPQPLSNIPLSPEQRSHFPSQRQLEQDGYDSDQGFDQNVGIISEGPQEQDEEDIPEEDPSGTTMEGTTAGPNEASTFPPPPPPPPPTTTTCKIEGCRIKRRTLKAWTT